ncbi:MULTISPECIES: nitroreductase/quinone reductase family protein [Parafrankia]|uniref:Nitroreductase n=1 Tax=Parafrankia colletiae TaxID=573497 RepID=A0A1S1RJS3_9ACTN|nr:MULTISPECIES: nitroreductase/quinone reductase family protein [Parafrankia]MCK9899763.1 nitroreductase family deazaflavin-dependent oxidoreductase [Frankia sp. Cpl3]OHV46356.1 nitroreductase [Parafrankia colletiae]
MVSERGFKALNATHRLLTKATRGRLGWRAGGMPVLELTTTGRRSGNRHTIMLTSPLRDGGAIVLVASRAGDDRHPDWYHNVCAHPDVDVRLRGGAWQPMHARVATPAERERLWPRVADTRWYENYQARSKRVIPLVLVEPR